MKFKQAHPFTTLVLLYLCAYLTFFPALSWAKVFNGSSSSEVTAPDSDALPEYVTDSGDGWSISTDDDAHYMEISQTVDTASIDWNTFDIGSDSTVYFDNGSGITLNRIYDSDPSLIWGSLSASGSIYLINYNGFVFGDSSSVLAASIVVSSLDITDEDFEDGIWHYQAVDPDSQEAYEAGNIVIEGEITAYEEGRILILGSSVYNNGTLEAGGEGGEVVLGAASEFYLTENSETETNSVTDVDEAEGYETVLTGEAVNNGTITVDVGEVGIYGEIVRNNGTITAVSTASRGSIIELVATDAIYTGEDSLIDSSVTNDTDQDGEYDEDLDDVYTDSPFADRALNMYSLDDEAITIELYGDIYMPSGDVSIDSGSGGTVYIGDGASIDLSGYWVEKDAWDQVIEAELNDEELRDEQDQIDGILNGETIYVLLREGTNIGNISDNLDRSLSAQEQATSGGTLTFNDSYGAAATVTIADGASIDISGGGVIYGSGYIGTTILVTADGEQYDISEAPDTLEYVDIINPGDDDYSNDNLVWVESYQVGDDAGSLTINANQVAFDGSLSAGATIGTYQVNESELVDDLGYTKTDETQIPEFGTLIIGDYDDGDDGISTDKDFNIEEIVVMEDAPTVEEVSLEDRDGETWLSEDLLSNSGLGTVELYANESITVDEGVTISLNYGFFIAASRSITVNGSIIVPSGTISLELEENITSFDDDDTNDPEFEGIEIGSQALLSTAGEQVDNSDQNADYQYYAYLDGGNIILQDNNYCGEGVVVNAGAELNVDGGYLIGYDGSLEDGGDAGSITIEGASIVLDGTVSGKSLDGYEGGAISLYALSVAVVSSLSDSSGEYGLTLTDSYFEDTGFADISLAAVYDLVISQGVSLSPSLTKMVYTGNGNVMDYSVDLDDLGDTAITLAAGVDNDEWVTSNDAKLAATLSVEEGASITVAPGGSISIATDTTGNLLDLSGIFTAMAGTITVDAASVLLVNSDARFYAQGYAMDTEETVNNGQIVWDLLDGGTISLSGSVVAIEEGAVLDVSGSSVVTLYLADSADSLTSYSGAAAPGSIEISYSLESNEYEGDTYTTSLDGTFLATKYLSTLTGGSFSLSTTGSALELSIDDSFVSLLEEGGFDALSLASEIGIYFDGSLTIDMDRSITLDAPLLTATNDSQVILNSAYIELTNTNEDVVSDHEAGGAGSTLAMNASVIDISGDIQALGFDTVSLVASGDITLTDIKYQDGDEVDYSGLFYVEGDLVLDSARTYVTTNSLFTLEAEGDITTLSSSGGSSDYIYSALGELTIQADNIYHYGVLAAPNGSITLIAENRVYLADGSELSIAGSDYDVFYGEVDETDGAWYGNHEHKVDDQDGSYDILIEDEDDLADKEILIEAGEVIAMDGSVINIEGGGEVFSYTFVASQEGSYDQLDMDGTYVIVPYMDNLSGDAVYLEGNDLIDEGLYTLLSSEYAFMDGAIVITYVSESDPTSYSAYTDEGYELVTGYDADGLTGYYSSEADIYYVRYASDVMDEGQYTTASLTTGSAGSFTVDAATTVLNSTLLASALSDIYSAGSISLSAANIIVSNTAVSLDDDFDQDDELDASMIGQLYVSAERLSEGAFYAISLGSEDTTDTITFENDSADQILSLSAQSITLVASDDITLGADTLIEGTGDYGQVSITSLEGDLVIDDAAAVTASYYLEIEAQDITGNQAGISSGSILSLASDSLFLVSQENQDLDFEGMTIEEALWSTFYSLDQITLSGSDSILFAGQIALGGTATNVVLDTPALAAVTSDAAGTDLVQATDVVITAQTALIYNPDANTTSLSSSGTMLADFLLDAQTIYLGQGDTQFIGYSTITLSSDTSLVFRGEGTLDTNNADLILDADLITASYIWIEDDEDEYTYEAADFEINAGTGTIAMTDEDGDTDTQEVFNIGGSLSFEASSIAVQTDVTLYSGTILMSATGQAASQGIYIGNGAEVSVEGYEYNDYSYDGGTIYYESASNIELADGSMTDVSAGSGDGDAGTLVLSNPEAQTGAITIASGAIDGSSSEGDTGSFTMDTYAYYDISSLGTMLSDASFTNTLDLRVRTGDVFLDYDASFSADSFSLTADEGSITLAGATIDASGEQGGTIALYAGLDITIENARLLASATEDGGDGGQIILSTGIADPGELNLVSTTINLSGGDASETQEAGDDGSLYIRAAAIDSDSDGALDAVSLGYVGFNTLIGVSGVTVEGVVLESYDTDATVTDSTFEAWEEDLSDFMDEIMVSDLEEDLDMSITLVAGLEVQVDGDLTIDNGDDYIYLNDWRFGDDDLAAVLTLKASGDVTINSTIKDNPTSYGKTIYTIDVSTDTLEENGDSTTINITAGASLASSDSQAVSGDTGALTLGDGVTIYTESGDLTLTSGGDMVIYSAPEVSSDTIGSEYNDMNLNPLTYNLGSYTGTVTVNSGGDLLLEGGTIQTAVGDIVINTQGDLILRQDDDGDLGTIRTVGEALSDLFVEEYPDYDFYATYVSQTFMTDSYSSGGNITINAGGDVVAQTNYGDESTDALNILAWDSAIITVDVADDGGISFTEITADNADKNYTNWSATYNTKAGDTGSTDASEYSVTQGIATMGDGDITITAGGDVFGQIGTFGEGDLTITAGGDIDGIFLSYDGEMTLTTMANFGSNYGTSVVEAFDSQITITAQGDIDLPAVVNPTLVDQAFSDVTYMSYSYATADSDDTATIASVALESVLGSVTIGGALDSYLNMNDTNNRESIWPAILSVTAAQDIVVAASIVLAPSVDGQLYLSAGNDITGTPDNEKSETASIIMSNADPDEVYGYYESDDLVTDFNAGVIISSSLHGDDSDDTGPVVVEAGNDIVDLQLYIPTAATITAGNDIINLNYLGQNLSEDDITLISAGGSITYFNDQTTGTDVEEIGITVGGPGLIIVTAGDSIDLGSSTGIAAIGSDTNPEIGEVDNTLIVTAGIAQETILGEDSLLTYVQELFTEAQEAGEGYWEASDDGDSDLMDEILADLTEYINSHLDGDGDGDITLVNSQIYTTSGSGSIYLVAGGELNVGISGVETPPILDDSTVSDDEDSGIYTEGGGDIYVFAGEDINVNESRVMTLDGGSILMVSLDGSVYAGNGSTVAYASSDTYTLLNNDGTYSLEYNPPALGSGVQANAPVGDSDEDWDVEVYVFTGVIDAGQAGIAGNDITLQATEILNAQNITVSGSATGFTVPSDSSSSVTGLSGTGGLADTSMMDEESSALASAKDKIPAEPEAYSVEPRWVDVEVLEFENDEEQGA